MKRIFLPCFLLLALCALCGCGSLNIEAGVDDENTAYLCYELKADLLEYSSEQRARFHWGARSLVNVYKRELGFSVEDRSTDLLVDITLEKREQTGSAEEAFDKLKAMLEDEQQTLFVRLEMARDSAERQQAYSFVGTLDMQQLLALSTVPDMHASVRQSLEEQYAACTGTVTVRLPASELEGETRGALLQDGLAQLQVPLSFTGETVLALATRVSLEEGRAVAQPLAGLAEAQQERAEHFAVLAAAGGALALAGLLLLVFGGRKKRKAKAALAGEKNEGGAQ